jgi:hypothetical protein
LYRGLPIALLRGTIVNACVMALYEQARGTAQLIQILAKQ